MSLLASGHPRSAPKRDYVSDWRRVGRYWVHRYSILTTDRVIYTCLELRRGWGSHRLVNESYHSTTMTGPKGEALGSVTSRSVPMHIDRIPVGPKRFAALDKWRARLESICYSAIREAYPESRMGERRHGEIELGLADVRRG